MKNKCSWLFLLPVAAAFYILPLIIRDTGSGMLVLLVIAPCVCFLTAVLFGIINRFNIAFDAVGAFLFLPSIFIFYNSSALFYLPAYFAVLLLGNLIGMLLNNFTK